MTLFFQLLIAISAVVIAYLLGSVSTSIIVGRLFFHKDVREYGSKNAGGTNVGRVLGKKAGIAVILLDILKAVFIFWLYTLLLKYTPLVGYFTLLEQSIVVHTSLFSLLLGHCFPVFFGFKGGKAVSCFAGYLLATNWLLLLVAFLIFLFVLKLKKYVSLASITAGASSAVLSWLLLLPALSFSFYLSDHNSLVFIISLNLFALILIVRHEANIRRLFAHTESKIKWMK